MKKKTDDNLDKNSQKQTVHFIYDEKQKFLWIDKYYFEYFQSYLQGFPSTMVKGGFFEAVKNKPELNFFGLEERHYSEITERQSNQYQIYTSLGLIPYFIGICLLLFLLSRFSDIFAFFLHGKILILFTPIVTYFIVFFTSTVTGCFIGSFFVTIYFRLLFRILEYLIAETLCIIQITNLNIELTRDDAIYRRDVKGMVLFRMDYLARVTMLIPLHYGMGRSGNQKWIEQHFQNISYYIRERRRWLIAPNETTLDDLRRDFRKITYYYLTGKYGAWQWQSFDLETEVIKQTRFQKIQGTLIRFFGVLLPLIIMGLLMLFPDKFPNLDSDVKSKVPYVFIGWLLVSIDVTLKLGVIESLVKLISGLKDLSK